MAPPHPNRAPRHPAVERRRFSLRTRLFAIVLVPTLLAAAFAGSLAQEERRAAARASQVSEDIAVLGALVDLRSALMSARIPVEVEARAAELGLDTSAGLALLDLDGLAFGTPAEVAVELQRLAPEDRPFEAADLAGLVASADREANLEVIERFEALEDAADATWGRNLQAVETQVGSLADAGLSRRLRDLDAAARLTSAMASMVTDLADHWFADLAGDPRSAEARVDLGVSSAEFENWIEVLRASPSVEVVAAAEAVGAIRYGGPFDDAIVVALTGGTPVPLRDGLDLDLIVATFLDSFAMVTPLIELVEDRSVQFEAGADRVADDARRSALLTFGAAGLMIVAVLALSLLVAVSVERPLRRLIESARRAGDGDLSAPQVPVGGPTEVAMATASFNDVVANLRLLEGKLEALAECDFADDRLARPLPGELGAALERSVDVLAASIRDRAELQERLAHEATHDPMTGLANRAGGMEALEGAIARARRNGTMVAVLFLDLDGFKAINDGYGHRAGDLVLQQVARRLDRYARSGDTCARLGGDEFIVVAELVTSTSGALVAGQRIAEAIAMPMTIDSHELSVGVSVGVAASSDGLLTPIQLLEQADRAAYTAKRSTRSVALYRNELVTGPVIDLDEISATPDDGTTRPTGSGRRRR